MGSDRRLANDIFYGFHTRNSALELLVQPPRVALYFDNPKPRVIRPVISRASAWYCALRSPNEVYDLWADFLLRLMKTQTPGYAISGWPH